MSISDAKRLRELEIENTRLKKLLAESLLDIRASREVRKKVVTAPARRAMVRYMQSRGLSERRALVVVRMGPNSLRYKAAPDRNQEQILVLAHRHRRDGAGMIYLRLRQQGVMAYHKRVERLYSEAEQCRRKKVPLGERQPLVRPEHANQDWSMDSVFDRSADGRVIKCLTIVDDATHECVAIVPERAISGSLLTRILDNLQITRGLPQIIRTDNGKEFCGRAMLSWAHGRGVTLRLIELGKPNQSAYVESFNGRFRDECLNENWFLNLAHGKSIIETWRREYNDERPKKALGGLTPSMYAKQMMEKTVKLNPGL